MVDVVGEPRTARTGRALLQFLDDHAARGGQDRRAGRRQALPRGGAEPGDAYRAHLDAITRRDLAGAKALWTGRQRAGWDENVKRFKAPLGMGFSEKDLFKSMAERMATDQTVLGGWINGDRATIRIEGTYDGTRAVADIDLTREAGTWKIAEQHRWQAVGDQSD